MGDQTRLSDEGGFSILECTIALSVIFVVLVALMGSLTAGARGVVTGRQRSAALALANEVMEDARGRAYSDVGHDFDSDPTLATDPLITGTAPNFLYTGVSPAEPLAASSVDAGATGGTVNNPLWPFSPHKFTSKREATVYTTQVYVTTVTPASGDRYKRISVKISWAPSQYANAARSVVLSSFLFAALSPPDPKLTGTGEADGGSFKVSGTLAGISLSDMSLTMPYVNGSIDSGFIRSAKGLARSGSSEVNLLSGLLSGCSLVGLSGSCDPALAQADADNDSGTAPPDTDQQGPTSASSATISALPGLSVGLGSGTAQAQASARSCWGCQAGGTPPVGDDDRLPFFTGRTTGPSNAAVNFTTIVPGVSGSLFSIGTGCSADCTAVTIDRDDTGNNPRLNSTATVSFPALSLMTFGAGAPAGYSGMVKFGAVTATATAGSGPGATGPTVTGSPVAVQMWDSVTGGYKTTNVTPGAASPAADPTAHAAFGIGLASVVMDSTLHWNKAVTSQTNSGGAVADASASLTNWLFVDLHVTITTLGVPVADLNLHFDYGRIAATADYQPAT